MRAFAIMIAVAAITCCWAQAQQLATNTAGHALTSNGSTPVPGTPFEINIANGATPLSLELSGASNAGFILGAGSLATMSPDLGLGAGNEIDIDLGLPATILINYLDTFAPLNFITPPFIDVGGQNPLDFQMTSAYLGLTANLQGIIQDIAEPALLGATATGSWTIISQNAVVGSGTDTSVGYTPSAPILIYGQSFPSISLSSNGTIRFAPDGGGFDAPFASNAAAFTNGDLGFGFTPAPVIASLWNELDGGAFANTTYEAMEPSPGVHVFSWNNYAPFLSTTMLGSWECTVDVSSGVPVVTLDYTNMLTTGVPLGFPGVVGISSGNTTILPTEIQEIDLITAGAANPANPITIGSPQSIFQDFGGAFPGPLDLDGVIATFVDTTATSEGAWTLF